MAVWVDKIANVDTIRAADVNQLADGFSAANTYNFGTDAPLKALCGFHVAGTGAHTLMIDTGDIVAKAVTLAKMADLASAQIYVGDAGARPVGRLLSGDATMDNGGVVTIAADAVSNTELANMARGTVKVGDAGGAPSDLAAGAGAQLLQANAATDPTWITMSGDAAIAVGGAVTVAADAITNTKLANMVRGTIKVGGVADAPTDLNAKAAGAFLCGNGTDVLSQVMGGDGTISAAGDLTIAALAVTNAKLAGMVRGALKVGSAAGAASDLAIGAAGTLLQSDAGGDDPAWVAVSGDVTIAAGGAVTIGAGKVTKANMVNAVLCGKGTTGARPAPAKEGFLYWNTSLAKLQRDTGGAFEDVVAAVSGPHIIWTESMSQTVDGGDAAALPAYKCGTFDTSIRVRLAVQKTADWAALAFRGQYYWSHIGGEPAPALGIHNETTGASAAPFTPLVGGAWTNFDEDDLWMDCSGLANGITYEFHFLLASTGEDTIAARYLAALIYPYSAPA